MAAPTSVVNPSAPPNLVEQLRRDEGYRQFPYTDTNGKLTIGNGFNLTDVGLSETESYLVLTYRAAAVRTELVKTLFWVGDLDAARQDALCNMAYNMGIPKLLEFRQMLAACKMRQWQTASDEMLNSKWASEVGARAHRLAVQIKTGVRQ